MTRDSSKWSLSRTYFCMSEYLSVKKGMSMARISMTLVVLAKEVDLCCSYVSRSSFSVLFYYVYSMRRSSLRALIF